MLLHIAFVLAFIWPWSRHAPPETLSRPAAEALSRQVHARCPVLEPTLRQARPVRVLEVLDAFRGQLSGNARAKLDEHLPRTPDGKIVSCREHPGASCQIDSYLIALHDTGLSDAFTLYLCGHGQRLF
jgi:hypothetical protein